MYIEYNLTDKCNLNCKGCAAFSPLVKENNSKSLKKIKEDFKKIYELSLQGKKVTRVTIMGGEPLLHHDINGAITYIATLFNYSEIWMVTNGILIPKMNDEFFSVVKIHNVTLCISFYPNSIDYQKIYALLDKKEINFKIYGDYKKRMFYHQYLKNEYDKNYKITNKDCWYRSLFILKDNKIYPCTEIAYFDYFDEEFKGQHNIKVDEDDFIDLDKINSFEELQEAKKRISPFCGFCKGNHKDTTEWDISKRDINEWICFK